MYAGSRLTGSGGRWFDGTSMQDVIQISGSGRDQDQAIRVICREKHFYEQNYFSKMLSKKYRDLLEWMGFGAGKCTLSMKVLTMVEVQGCVCVHV